MKRVLCICPSAAIRKLWCLLTLSLLLMSGCATRTAVKQPIFFPPAPDEPRIQYLTSYTLSTDLEPPPNKLWTFLTGYKGSPKPILKPYGIRLAGGRIFVCDTELACICVLDLEKRAFSYLTPRGVGAFSKPINLDTDKDGNFYVADAERHRIAKYSAEGRYLTAITGDDAFRPVAVVVHNDKIYSADTKGRKISVFDKNSGAKLFSIPKDAGTNEVVSAINAGGAQDSNIVENANTPGPAPDSARIQTQVSPTNEATTGDPNLYLPINVAVDEEGNIYVTDAAAFRIQIYDKKGRHVKAIGSHGAGFGEFARPKGIALDRANRIFVVDAAAQVVQVFDTKTGRLLLYFGDPNENEASLDLPAGIDVDYDNVRYFQKLADPGFEIEHLVLVTNQLGPRRISVFGFGHKRK